MKSVTHQSLQKRLNIAKLICQQHNERLTPLRTTLLELVCQSDKPISAYHLLKLLKKSYPNAEAMTVYRGLEFWIKLGVLHKLTTNNTYTACIYPIKKHFGQLMLCRGCGKSTEIHEANLTQFVVKTAKKNHFLIHPQLIEVSGLCEYCQ